MKTPAQRGADGLWLREARLARGFASAEAARQALEKSGLYIAKSVYAQYEAGSRPIADHHRAGLERYWGPPTAQESIASGGAEELLRQLVEETRMSRVAQETTAQALSELAGMVARLLPPEGTPADIEREVAGGTRR